MTDAGIIAAIITGSCALTLAIVQQLMKCCCPGKCISECHCGSPPKNNNATLILDKLYEEPDVGFKKYHWANNNNNKWIIKIPEENKYVHIYREIFERPKTKMHFLRVKLKNVTPNSVTLFVKRFKGPPNEWSFCEEHRAVYHQEASEGVNIMEMPSVICDKDVTKEQVGVTITSSHGTTNAKPVTCIIEEAYYDDKPINICGCLCNTSYFYWRCLNNESKTESSDE